MSQAIERRHAVYRERALAYTREALRNVKKGGSCPVARDAIRKAVESAMRAKVSLINRPKVFEVITRTWSMVSYYCGGDVRFRGGRRHRR